MAAASVVSDRSGGLESLTDQQRTHLDLLLVLMAVVNLLRGVAIGVAEVIPGVSGGTIALLVGIYRRLIDAGATGVVALRQLLGLPGQQRGWTAAVTTSRDISWSLVLPVVLGMGAAVMGGARVIEPLLDDYPVAMRAVFFGLVAAGIAVPVRIVLRHGPWRSWWWLVFIAAAGMAFALTGLPPTNISDPSLILVALAAAVAVSALVLPGVSGSFFLLSVGLYDSTIAAVNDRNYAYLAVFALGAVVGLAAFVSLLRWLLDHRLAITMVVLSGLMLGSLRALWPWQDDGRNLQAPDSDLLLAIVLAVASGLIVVALIRLEHRFGASEEDAELNDAQ